MKELLVIELARSDAFRSAVGQSVIGEEMVFAVQQSLQVFALRVDPRRLPQ